jgi:hypothetical protein
VGIIYIEQYIASDGLRVWSVVTGTIFGYYGGSARCGVRGEVYGREVRGAWPQGGPTACGRTVGLGRSNNLQAILHVIVTLAAEASNVKP